MVGEGKQVSTVPSSWCHTDHQLRDHLLHPDMPAHTWDGLQLFGGGGEAAAALAINILGAIQQIPCPPVVAQPCSQCLVGSREAAGGRSLPDHREAGLGRATPPG